MSETEDIIEETSEVLQRLQDFDVHSLVRESELGQKFALKEAVEPTKRVIDLFKLINPAYLHFFPDRQLNVLRDQANAFFNLLEECLAFDLGEASPTPVDAKNELIARLKNQFQPVFDQLFPLISFASVRSLDFTKLERDARAATQAAKDSSATILKDLDAEKKKAESVVEEVRKVAAEQGVSTQAIHFKNEADEHKESAKTWQDRTVGVSMLLGAYAVGTLFIHNIPGTLSGEYGAFQLAISKFLIFAVIAYVLFLCAKNFMSHKHNEIVNRHRQNALATFTTLAEATSDAASSDIVLSHAASCIFSPQETGYTKQDSVGSEKVPGLQIIPRIGSVAPLSSS